MEIHKKIINAHMNALVNLPIVENARELKALRHLYDEVEANVRALSALGRKAEEYGVFLLPLMFHKIPEEIRLSICNRVSKENWNLEAVFKELKQELQTGSVVIIQQSHILEIRLQRKIKNCHLLRSQVARDPLHLCTDGGCLLWPASFICSVYYCHQCSKAQGNFKEECSLFHLYQEKSPQ